jgi:hypothetical protein
VEDETKKKMADDFEEAKKTINRARDLAMSMESYRQGYRAGWKDAIDELYHSDSETPLTGEMVKGEPLLAPSIESIEEMLVERMKVGTTTVLGSALLGAIDKGLAEKIGDGESIIMSAIDKGLDGGVPPPPPSIADHELKSVDEIYAEIGGRLLRVTSQTKVAALKEIDEGLVNLALAGNSKLIDLIRTTMIEVKKAEPGDASDTLELREADGENPE